MSVTCLHLLDDAPANAHCDGCRAVTHHIELLARDVASNRPYYLIAVDPGVRGGECDDATVIVHVVDDHLEIPDVARRAPAITARELEHAVAAAELKAEPRRATSLAHRPGARRPGITPTPTVPRWARDRRPRQIADNVLARRTWRQAP